MRLTFRKQNASTVIAPKPLASCEAADPAQFPMLARSEAFAEDLTDPQHPVVLSDPFAFSCQHNSLSVAR